MTSEAAKTIKDDGGKTTQITRFQRPYKEEMLRQIWREALRVIMPPGEPPAPRGMRLAAGRGKTVEILTLVNQRAKNMKRRSPSDSRVGVAGEWRIDNHNKLSRPP